MKSVLVVEGHGVLSTLLVILSWTSVYAGDQYNNIIIITMSSPFYSFLQPWTNKWLLEQ